MGEAKKGEINSISHSSNIIPIAIDSCPCGCCTWDLQLDCYLIKMTPLLLSINSLWLQNKLSKYMFVINSTAEMMQKL